MVECQGEGEYPPYSNLPVFAPRLLGNPACSDRNLIKNCKNFKLTKRRSLLFAARRLIGKGAREVRKLFLMIVFLPFVLQGISSADSCITDKCHSKIGKEKYVHGPVAVGECLICHEKTGAHKFKRIVNVRSLCFKCHDSKTGIHNNLNPKTSEGYRECCNCHDAHQSPQPHMLLVKQK